MKSSIKIFILLLTALLCSCEWNYFPTDEITGAEIVSDKNGLTYIMNGCYATLKDPIEYLGYASGNDYCRHYFQMTEYVTDNICLCAPTTDALYQALSFTMTDDLKNVGTLWMLAYRVINMCNTVIEASDNVPDFEQLKGEAYFLRAMLHLHMVTLFSKPYYTTTDGIHREYTGVPLRTSTANTPVTRATVGEVYDQIVRDLQLAAQLLPEQSRGNAGYPCRAAAWGLLSRVHLYMGDYDAVLTDVTKALNGASMESKLASQAEYASYFANAKTSSETLFCIAHELVDDKGQGSLGSMYNGADNGWGEVYPSNPLLYLYERYPNDLRYTAYIQPQYAGDASDTYQFAYFPIPKPESDPSYRLTMVQPLDKNARGYYFRENSVTYYMIDSCLAGGYHEWHVTYKGTDCLARVHKKMLTGTKDNNPQWFVLKFANQDGKAHLSSPVYLRWAEVLLNRAEAEAKTNPQAAIDDVNLLRKRAGLSGDALFSSATDHGYSSALDIVLDERRLELAFEGHRLFDMMRNARSMDRRYPGANPWQVVPYNYPRLQYPIPYAEWSVSGITQNPGY